MLDPPSLSQRRKRDRSFFVACISHAFRHGAIARFQLRNGRGCGKLALPLGVAGHRRHTHVVYANIDVPRRTTQPRTLGTTSVLVLSIVHSLLGIGMNSFTPENNTHMHHHLHSCSLRRVKPSRLPTKEPVKLELTSVRGRHPSTKAHVWRVANARVSTFAMASAVLRSGCVSWTYL